MTSYSYRYVLSEEMARLLRDLVIYQISLYDSEIAAGGTSPFIARRAEALRFLPRINPIQVIGTDSTAVMMWDVIKLCEPVSEEIREKFKRTTLQFGAEDGLIGILCMYSNELITELKSVISDQDSDEEDNSDDDEYDLIELLRPHDDL
jgi:hypothetical protein